MSNPTITVPDDIIRDDLSLTFSLSKRRTVNKIFANVSGSFTIKNIDLIAETLIPVIKEFDQVTIKSEGLNDIDLTAAQFLYRCTSAYEGLALKMDLPQEVKADFSTAGLTDIFLPPTRN